MSARDTNHYWDVLIFSVEGSLFKLPKYQLVKNSEVFETMCSLPQGAQSNEGSCDDNPIKLEGVKCEDFKRFAEVLYPLEIPQQLVQKTKEEWISILKLSTMWRFLRLRALAINSLAIVAIDPIERVQLARDYSVSAWLRSGYIDIASQESALSDREVAILGYASAIRMFQARERILKQRLMHVSTVVEKYVSMVAEKYRSRPPDHKRRMANKGEWVEDLKEPDYKDEEYNSHLVHSEVEREFREEFEEADAANKLYDIS